MNSLNFGLVNFVVELTEKVRKMSIGRHTTSRNKGLD